MQTSRHFIIAVAERTQRREREREEPAITEGDGKKKELLLQAPSPPSLVRGQKMKTPEMKVGKSRDGMDGEREAETVRETTALTRLLGMSGTLADHLAALQRCTCRRRQWRGVSKARQELQCTGRVKYLAKPVAHALYAEGKCGLNSPITPKKRREGKK